MTQTFLSRDPAVARAIRSHERRLETVHVGRRDLTDWAGRDLACRAVHGRTGPEVPVGFVATAAEHEDSAYYGPGPRTMFYSVKHGIVMPVRHTVTGVRLQRELVGLTILPLRVPGLPTSVFSRGLVRSPGAWADSDAAWVALESEEAARRVDRAVWEWVPAEVYWYHWSTSYNRGAA